MNLRSEYRNIKSAFFPRWDRESRWRVSTASGRRVHGRCDSARKVIEFVIVPSDPDERDVLLIHEISHAVASGGHGKIWQARMEKAAKRADDLGRGRLASLLRQEISAYQEGGIGVRRRTAMCKTGY